MDKNQKRMRSRDINALVTVTLPAHVWLGFMASYGNTKWSCAYTSEIMLEARDALFDPIFVSEREAEAQRQHDKHHELLSGMLPPGFLPPRDDDVPPDASGLDDDS